jgi:hypothetical protein
MRSVGTHDTAEPIMTEWSMTMFINGIPLRHSGLLEAADNGPSTAEAELKPAEG